MPVKIVLWLGKPQRHSV